MRVAKYKWRFSMGDLAWQKVLQQLILQTALASSNHCLATRMEKAALFGVHPVIRVQVAPAETETGPSRKEGLGG